MKLNPGETVMMIAVTIDDKAFRKGITKQWLADAVKACIERYSDQDFAKWQEKDGHALLSKTPLSMHRSQ